MADLFADEDFPYQAVYSLRGLGHSVTTAREAGLASQPDPAILAAATRAGRCTVTHNRKDFMRLHRQVPQHAGIIVCTTDYDYDALAKRVDVAIRQNEPLSGKLLRVNLPG